MRHRFNQIHETFEYANSLSLSFVNPLQPVHDVLTFAQMVAVFRKLDALALRQRSILTRLRSYPEVGAKLSTLSP